MMSKTKKELEQNLIDQRMRLGFASEIRRSTKKGYGCPHSSVFCNADRCLLKAIDETKRCGGYPPVLREGKEMLNKLISEARQRVSDIVDELTGKKKKVVKKEDVA